MDSGVLSSGSAKGGFRSDIQAMRGIAVMLVLIYHAGSPWLPAGYLGVDIFFVISGYLITTLIKKHVDNGTFSFRDFYFRRAKRLLPAAYAVLIASIILAPFFLAEQEITEMRDQVIGAITFTANLVLWQQSGYFDGAAETKIFLHFWSLAIEEQYYIIVPALLFYFRQDAGRVLAAIGAASLAFCLFLVLTHPAAAFYLLPTRAWELMIGSLGAMLPARYVGGRMLSLARIPAIIVMLSIPFYQVGTQHPGLDAILVCVAALVIILGHDGNFLEMSPPVRGIALVGNLSYSLYLVHWPVIVFTRSAWLGEPPMHAMVIAVVIAMVVSYLLYKYVEEPFRLWDRTSSTALVAGLTANSLLIIMLPSALSLVTAKDIDFSKLRRTNYGIDRSCVNKSDETFNAVGERCQTQPNARALIWGDSYAMAWATALKEPMKKVGGLEQATMSACDPLTDMARFPKQASGRYNRDFARRCMAFNAAVLDYIRQNPNLDTVIIAGRLQTVLSTNNLMMVVEKGKLTEREISSELVAKGVENTVNAVRAAGKKIVLLAPPPATGVNIGDCLERRLQGKITFGELADCDLSWDDVIEYRRETTTMLDLAVANSNLDVININDFLCDNSRCRTMIDGVPLYRDAGHLSVIGAELIGRKSPLAKTALQKAR